MEYSCSEREIIDAFEKFKCGKNENKFHAFLKTIPVSEKRFKCFNCYAVFTLGENKPIKCPACERTENIAEACPLEQFDNCRHDVSPNIEYCPICRQAVCPQCGTNHDVMQISRVTGYLQDVAGWNNGKIQELKDRKRYNNLG